MHFPFDRYSIVLPLIKGYRFLCMQRNIMKGVPTMFTWLFNFIADNWMDAKDPSVDTVKSIGGFIDTLNFFLFGWMFMPKFKKY